ncbi:hypothetical protein Micbo1qcDRAFT_1462 [Microdochium bolleyi]|uniref:Uncharacterized protein n=1 Tax=Microdochium bolleyi TaxID=196109 RepID=A0A136JHD1_9PEZI|nr:hypothetical protein Micbo1qcDRAFT_1462 [Microdochium bolleyi]
MSPSDKRRSVHQAAATPSSSSALRSSNGSRASAIIAAPPRAQLHSVSSSSPTRAAHEGESNAHEPNSNPHLTNSASSKESTSRSSAAKGGSAKDKDSSQLIIREKDEKIATLKRELAGMASEFERTLDKLSHSESETASFWQAKHAALNQQFTRVDTELQLLNAELEIRMAEREEMRESLEGMRKDLGDREEEARSLKVHLAKMKQWISTSTRITEDQTSDQQFAEIMMKLMNGLQNWVISHFKKARLVIHSAGEEVAKELARLVPTFEQVASQSKVALLQTIVARIMVEVVFEPYFAGLPDDQSETLRQHEHDLSQMLPAEAINQWRASTLALVRKHSANTIREHTACLIDGGVARLNQVFDAITDTETTTTRDQAARAFLGNALELAQALAVQKAQFKVDMHAILPHHQIPYDFATMEDVGGEDDEDLIGREVLCVIFPALVKTGDVAGEHLHFKNVICKAKVVCAAE